MAPVTVLPLGRGGYRVEHDGKGEIVYVAESGTSRWVFWNGHVFRTEPDASTSKAARGHATVHGVQTLEAPMPARVLKILVAEGAEVKKGETVVLLEAMKMELPVRAPADLTVKS